jgi:peptide/nickel transport system ATP-binding protein
MKQWQNFYKRYMLLKQVTRLLTALVVALILLSLVCSMVYSELSNASDYARALLTVAEEELGKETGYAPQMATSELPRLYIENYDALLEAVPHAEVRRDAGELLIVYYPAAKIAYYLMLSRFWWLYAAGAAAILAVLLGLYNMTQKFDRDVTCEKCGAVSKGSVVDKQAGICPSCGAHTSGGILLEAKKVNKIFGAGKGAVHAVKDVDFTLHRGEIISIVGESGSGKTTFAKILLGLLNETSGEIDYNGAPRFLKTQPMKRAYWQNIQAIFQDPFSTFNQFFRVEKILNDCLILQGLGHLPLDEKRQRMKDACQFVNLKYEELYNKYPFELSGGQMQRLMIARIFMMQPNVLIADEPTSMIDACSRSTILDMLMKLRNERGMTIVFITHDLGLAYYVSDTLYIMERGEMVEKGPADQLILNPQHRYTRQLVADVPKLNEEWKLDA